MQVCLRKHGDSFNRLTHQENKLQLRVWTKYLAIDARASSHADLPDLVGHAVQGFRAVFEKKLCRKRDQSV